MGGGCGTGGSRPVKVTTGKVTNNPDLEAKGKPKHNLGKVEKKVGQIEKVLEK